MVTLTGDVVSVTGTVESERDRAIAALYSANYLPLVRMAFLLTSDNALAEELVQEAFVVTWRAWDSLDEPAAALGYLRRTLVNLARMSIRRRVLELRHRVIGGDDRVEHDPAGRIDLERLVARLPHRKRTCVVLRYFADLSEEETARVLGISVGAVKSSTARALKDLERAVGQDGGATMAGGDLDASA
jgi:RNA polymerase sigma-70 factor (sigma-E family)